jgi:predicted enzyme related to lactoylglutathione lyase
MADTNIGRFVWYDLLTSDTSAAASFYEHVVGWKSQPWKQGYTMFTGGQGGGPKAGTAQMPEEAQKMGAPPHWTSNVFVADVDATIAQVRKLGGKVLMEPSDFPEVGRLAGIADPHGAAVHLFKPKQAMTLPDSTKPGEFTWSELVTTDHEAAFRFYSTIFGWERRRDFDMGPNGKYLIYGTPGKDGKDLGGMFTKSKDMPMPPSWLYYIQVIGLDGAIDRAQAKGARVLNGPMEVPGGARIAQLADPQGSAFALHEEASR